MNLQNFTIQALREYTSKLQLAKILDVSTRTLYQYHDTAMLIEEFESEYPAFTNGDYPITSASLTKYQCWVIFSLMLVCRRLPHKDVHLCLLQSKNVEFTNKFSKESFRKYTESNYELERICTLAEYAAS